MMQLAKTFVAHQRARWMRPDAPRFALASSAAKAEMPTEGMSSPPRNGDDRLAVTNKVRLSQISEGLKVNERVD
jgi:hypothetical protein